MTEQAVTPSAETPVTPTAAANETQPAAAPTIPSEFKPQGEAAPAATTAPYFPEGLPDHLRGTSEKETLDKVYKAYDGARKAISEKGSVPAKADEYAKHIPDEIKQLAGLKEHDPALQSFQKAAHTYGLTEKQFSGLMSDFVGSLAKDGLLVPAINFQAELDALQPDASVEPDAKRRESAAAQIVQDNATWINGLLANNSFNEAEVEELKLLVGTANGNRALQKLRNSTAGDGFKTAQFGGGASEADLDAARKDPRYATDSHKFSKEFRAYWDEQAKKIHGV